MDPKNIITARITGKKNVIRTAAPTIAIAAVLTAILTAAPLAHAQVSEAQVFEWWDAGVITPEQAEEMLTLLDEGDQEEVCLMAEVYAQESCSANDDRATKRATRESEHATKRAARHTGGRTEKTSRPSLAPHGYALYKARFDSLGHLESHREELQISFYRYTLKLGSQELLTYKNEGSEAYFGQISSRELHSHFLLDTLWGTALLYPIGNFHVAGLLDTSMVTQFRLGYRFGKTGLAEGVYWENRRHDAHGVYSFALQTKSNAGKISAWYQQGQRTPLVKIELHGSSKNASSSDNAASPSKNAATSSKNAAGSFPLEWRTTAYYHGDSVPDLARLSTTILKSRLWGSQTISAKAKNLMNTQAAVNVRFINPLHSDSVSTRIKGTVQSGPDFLRGTAQATCLEAQDNCNKIDYRGALEWYATEHLTTGGSARTRHTRHAVNERRAEFSPPNLEAHLQFQDTPGNFAKVTVKFPDASPAKQFQLQNEGHFTADFLEISVVTTFKRTLKKDLHPSQATITAKISF